MNLQNQQCCSLTGLVVFYVILLILWGNIRSTFSKIGTNWFVTHVEYQGSSNWFCHYKNEADFFLVWLRLDHFTFYILIIYKFTFVFWREITWLHFLVFSSSFVMFNLAKIYTYIYIKIKVKTLLRRFLSPYIHITYFYGTLSLYIPIAAWRFPKNFQGCFIIDQ